ncbi:hypothetical protein HK405_007338, partial [Cladochytrium tenue]
MEDHAEPDDHSAHDSDDGNPDDDDGSDSQLSPVADESSEAESPPSPPPGKRRSTRLTSRPTSTQQSPSQKRKDKQIDDSDNDEDDQGGEEDDEDDDDDDDFVAAKPSRRSSGVAAKQSRTTSPKTPRASAKSTPRKKQQRKPRRAGAGAKTVADSDNAADPTSGEGEKSGNEDADEDELADRGQLFAGLMTGASVQVAVTEWLDSYDESPEDAMTELINFVIECCGTKGSLQKDAILDSDLVATTLEEMQAEVKIRASKHGETFLQLAEDEGSSDVSLLQTVKIIFVHRYRDIDPTIRAECMKELGVWITKFPDLYLDASYLRYVGWMLSDKSPQVRLESLRVLLGLFGSSAHRAGLRQFAERFKPRLIEMATREIHSTSHTAAIHLMGSLSEAGFLEDADRVRILPPLLFSVDAHFRAQSGKMAAETWKSEYMEPAVEDAEASAGILGDDIKTAWIRAKSLARMLVDLASGTAAGATQEDPNGDHGDDHGDDLFASLSQSLDRARSELARKAEDDDDDDAMDQDPVDPSAPIEPPSSFVELDEETKENVVRELRLSQELSSWCEDLDGPAAPGEPLGPAKITAAVSALYDHVHLLKNVEDILEYLSGDFSRGADALDSQSQSAYELAPHEETCLTMILSACVRTQLSESDGEKHRKERDAGDGEASTRKLDRLLVQFVPKLIRKYGSEFDRHGLQRLVECLKLVQAIDPEVYLDLRMLKAFENLLEDLCSLFLRHSNKEVLREFQAAFSHLMGQTPAAGEPTLTEVKKKRIQAMERRGDESEVMATSGGLHKTASDRVEALAEQCISQQIVAGALAVKSAVDAKEGVAVDDLQQLRNALVRLATIANFVDLTDLAVPTSALFAESDAAGGSIVPSSVVHSVSQGQDRSVADLLYVVLEIGLGLQASISSGPQPEQNVLRRSALLPSEGDLHVIEREVARARTVALLIGDALGLLCNQAMFLLVRLAASTRSPTASEQTVADLRRTAVVAVPRLREVCEAIATSGHVGGTGDSDSAGGYAFQAGTRMQAVRVLTDLYLILAGPVRTLLLPPGRRDSTVANDEDEDDHEGDAAAGFPAEMPGDVQEASVAAWTDATLALALPDRYGAAARDPRVLAW